MKNKCIYFALFLLTSVLPASSQVNADWPNQDFMFFSINPAMTADATGLSLGITHGRRWSKIRSSPSISNFAIRAPFRKQKMAFGAHIFSDKVGPLAGNGIDLAYAYKIRTGWSEGDQLSLGLSIRLMQLNFEKDHLIASQEDDPLFDNIDPKKIVPPSMNIGFKYTTGEADYYHPVQLVFAASAYRFLPFEDRFNSLSIDHVLQWYGLVGLKIAATESVLIEPGLFLSNLDKSVFNYAFRVKASMKNYGWLMTQFSKAGFLTTEIGFKLGELEHTGEVFRLSIGNSWYFGTLATQIGNSLTFGLSYLRPLKE